MFTALVLLLGAVFGPPLLAASAASGSTLVGVTAVEAAKSKKRMDREKFLVHPWVAEENGSVRVGSKVLTRDQAARAYSLAAQKKTGEQAALLDSLPWEKE